MCIAIAKPIGVDIPNENILKNCWDNNDDGAGFSFNYDNRVFIKKGFMKYDDFIEAFRRYNKKYDFKNCGVLLHFRIATHGARDGSMTHPFPIVDDAGCLKKLEYVSDYSVIHNGIITLTSTTANKSDGLSDTALFIKDYLTKIAGNKAWMRKKCNIELIEKMIESKMAIMDRYGNIKMTSGFTEDNGVFYSNSSYKDSYHRYVYTKTYDSKYTNSKGYTYCWDDDYGYEYDYGQYGGGWEGYGNYSTSYEGIMKVKAGWYIDAPDFSEEVTSETEGDYYVDRDNSLYLKEVEHRNGYNKSMYIYIGNCDVLDRNLNPIEFKADTWVSESQFDCTYYNDFPNDDDDDDGKEEASPI